MRLLVPRPSMGATMDPRLASTHPACSTRAMTADRVLIVDDDELILKALARILESSGFDPRCYLGPEEALANLDSDAPVVIISDYMMPAMDGVTFLKAARARFPGAVRILCTAAEDFRVALQAVNAGEVFRIISKPWHQHELLATVNQAAEAARLRRENERLTAEVQRQNGQLREINLRLEEMVRHRTQALLEGLIAALDYRDAETQWHSRRVSLYARRLAQQLGIQEPDLTVIEHGALLHDIGKIGVRDRVLLKPGPLTTEEWTEMKRHPELGWALLQRVDYLRPASAIVLQHQEKWDGSGYPAGLRTEDIVIGARIFHIVDTLDAITSDRPYRKSRPFGEARDEITRCGGTQFDPKIVEAFLAVPPEDWERIRLDVETVAVLSADLAENPPGAEELLGALETALRA
jgi:putative nucleotidyltransferase with HDIG domain